MKHKKIISTLLFILCFQFILGFFVVQVNAADAETKGIKFTPSVSIPTIGGGTADSKEIIIDGSFSAIKGVISGFYKYGLGVAGILATIMLAFGGITWLSSGGNASQIQRAKQYITGALTGLVLGLLSYTMLYIVNPDIVELKTNPKGVEILKNIEGGCGFVKAGTCGLDGKSEISADATRCGEYPKKTLKEESWDCCCFPTPKRLCSLDDKDNTDNPQRWGCGVIHNDCIGVKCETSTRNICVLNKSLDGSYTGGSCISSGFSVEFRDKKDIDFSDIDIELYIFGGIGEKECGKAMFDESVGDDEIYLGWWCSAESGQTCVFENSGEPLEISYKDGEIQNIATSCK